MKKRRILSIILCALYIAGIVLVPMQAQASESDASYLTYEVKDGKATITGCTADNIDTLEIPGSIDGYPVVSIGAHAFEKRNDLIHVTIPEGVQTIEPYAFYQCRYLQRMTYPESLITIGKNAFCGDSSLISLPYEGNLKEIGEGAYSYCKNLFFYMSFPYTLERIGPGAFYDCDTLESVLLPSSLKEIGYRAFAMCSRLDYIYIPDGIPKIGSQLLYGSACYYYKKHWYGDAFYIGQYLLEAKKSICGSYTTLGGITNIADNAFEDCYDLTQIILPDSLKIIGANAFDNCDGLQSVVIPSSVTTIEDKAFYNCKNLADIQISAAAPLIGKDVFTKTAFYNNKENWDQGVLYAGSCLVECKGSVSGALQVRPGTTTIVAGAMSGQTKLTELTLPDTVTTIGEKAIYGCTRLKTISFGKGLSQIGTSAFGQCSALENIIVHDENKTYRVQNNCLIRDKTLVLGCNSSRMPQDGSVTHIGAYAFEGCGGLTEVIIPDTVTHIEEGAFRYCHALTSVKLGNGVQVVGKRAFETCNALSQIDLGQSVHTIDDHGFAYNHQLTEVTFPASLRQLGLEAFSNCTGITSLHFSEGLVSIGQWCFIFCENLTSLHLPDSLKDIKSGAFDGCEKLATLKLGEGLITIGSVAFGGCKALENLVIPNSVQTIGSSAFEVCTGLRQLELGNVKEIEDWAFTGCSNLTQVHIPASMKNMGRAVFSYCPAIEIMTVSQENPYYHSSGNCIIRTDDKYMASGCKNSIIPDDGSVTLLDSYCFAGCSSLKSIVVPDQVTRIFRFAFLDCSGLEFMQLPFIGIADDPGSNFGYIFGALSGIFNHQYVPASLKRVVITGGSAVGGNAFYMCPGLEEIVLPESITSIDYEAFAKCSQLQRVFLPGNLQTIKYPNIFDGSPNAKLYISAGQDNTKSLVVSNDIPYYVGGMITFLDDQGGIIKQSWYSLNAPIIIPELPQKPANDRYTYEAIWSSVPTYCKGNETVQVRYIAHRIGGAVEGDVNGDDQINSLDGLLLMRYLNGWDVNIASPEAIDVNGDGKVNSLDGLLLMRYLNGWNVTLG